MYILYSNILIPQLLLCSFHVTYFSIMYKLIKKDDINILL